MHTQTIFGLFELPFLIICITFAFLTAKSLKGGKFGSGMNFLAWGFLVMAVGHLSMQIDSIYNFNLFTALFGNAFGHYFWYIALIVTWSLSGTGFYKIYKASIGN